MLCLRSTLDGIWWILCTGSMWNQLPEKYGKWNSVWRCYRRWCDSGMWDYILARIVEEATEAEVLRMLDTSHVKAHQDAARTSQSPEEQCLGKTKGGRNTKVSAVVNAEGKAIKLVLVPGNQHDSKSALKSLGTQLNGATVLADKAYDTNEIRKHVEDNGGTPNIPPKANRIDPPSYDKELGKQRRKVENFFCRIKSYRRVSTRYDKLAVTYMGFVTLSSIVDWLKI